MKIYPPLKWITICNLLLCFFTFYGMDSASGRDQSALGMSTAFGWILWLGIFSFIAPLILGNERRITMFQSPYLRGTFFIFFINLLGTLFCCFYVRSLFPQH